MAETEQNPPSQDEEPANLIEDLSKLSVRELKQQLQERGVSYGDCIEKKDLVERLQTTIQNQKKGLFRYYLWDRYLLRVDVSPVLLCLISNDESTLSLFFLF